MCFCFFINFLCSLLVLDMLRKLRKLLIPAPPLFTALRHCFRRTFTNLIERLVFVRVATPIAHRPKAPAKRTAHPPSVYAHFRLRLSVVCCLCLFWPLFNFICFCFAFIFVFIAVTNYVQQFDQKTSHLPLPHLTYLIHQMLLHFHLHFLLQLSFFSYSPFRLVCLQHNTTQNNERKKSQIPKH